CDVRRQVETLHVTLHRDDVIRRQRERAALRTAPDVHGAARDAPIASVMEMQRECRSRAIREARAHLGALATAADIDADRHTRLRNLRERWGQLALDADERAIRVALPARGLRVGGREVDEVATPWRLAAHLGKVLDPRQRDELRCIDGALSLHG